MRTYNTRCGQLVGRNGGFRRLQPQTVAGAFPLCGERFPCTDGGGPNFTRCLGRRSTARLDSQGEFSTPPVKSRGEFLLLSSSRA